ncbi:hypothetical protein [Pseudomonas kermanshahensis]|uniref:hypothetical protein n=1 Tax=Pseudomonas kermanshahensis TaxID=2745482 RepID=UPI002093BE7C|nr:hypothetical protein [Pseudomonas kermanshahensis]USS56987.1 hypothetical protein NG836_08845 [Pseudomonas kermanshahensis]
MPLTADRNTPLKQTDIVVIAAGAGVRIFAGSLIALNATGFAIPGKTATGLTYVGRAEESVDNTAGADGAVSVKVHRNRAFKWANDGTVTQARLLKLAYIVDDATVAAADGTGTRSAAGLVVGIDSDGVWVE